jgi:hypothetical protein
MESPAHAPELSSRGGVMLLGRLPTLANPGSGELQGSHRIAVRLRTCRCPSTCHLLELDRRRNGFGKSACLRRIR